MLKSMTAFARQDIETEAGTLTWEVRTVNHRYLEPHFRLPDNFREIEPALRECLRKHLARGKVDISLKFQSQSAGASALQVNQEVLEKLNAATEQAREVFLGAAPINLLEVLSWPGVINSDSSSKKELNQAALKAFEDALKVLVKNRLREGAQLAPLFEDRLTAISNIVTEVRSKLPSILAQQSDNIRKRFDEASVELDPARLEQELVLLAQKSDVAEELDRLDAHVVEVRNTLGKGEPIGRRLDFLMQELNREANTLSSKAIVTDTTNAAIELKVLIEQMREQVQNVE